MKTTDTTLEFTISEDSELSFSFGEDAEYYEQDGQTFVVSFEGGMAEAFAIKRDTVYHGTTKLTTVETPERDFDWESAEAFRGGSFPKADFS